LDDPKPDTLITVYQAAERLSFTTQYVYELIRKGQLQAIRNGKYVRILNSDLDAWIERNREKGIESQLYNRLDEAGPSAAVREG